MKKIPASVNRGSLSLGQQLNAYNALSNKERFLKQVAVAREECGELNGFVLAAEGFLEWGLQRLAYMLEKGVPPEPVSVGDYLETLKPGDNSEADNLMLPHRIKVPGYPEKVGDFWSPGGRDSKGDAGFGGWLLENFNDEMAKHEIKAELKFQPGDNYKRDSSPITLVFKSTAKPAPVPRGGMASREGHKLSGH